MKSEFETGPSSADTHRLTQPSTTLNRRYVNRPTNLAIEEAARMADLRDSYNRESEQAPSRLVNLRVHDDDIAAAKLRASQPQTPAKKKRVVMPRVIELGGPEANAHHQELGKVVTKVEEKQEKPSAVKPAEKKVAKKIEISAEKKAEEPKAEAKSEEKAAKVEEAQEKTAGKVEKKEVKKAEKTETLPVKASEMSEKELAMSIAADYTAASLGATMSILPAEEEAEQKSEQGLEEIAAKVSEYIKNIREAKDSKEISKNIEDLKKYAEEIRSSSDLPEIKELGETIEKFVAVTEKSTGVKNADKKEVVAPKVTRAAAKVDKSVAKMMPVASKPAAKKAMPAARPVARSVAKAPVKSVARNTVTKKDEEVLKKTMRSMAKMEEKQPKASKKVVPKRGRVKRFVLAFGCAIACVAGIGYFVMSNIPDISVRVAAMQAGVEASYPSYIPSEFSLDGIEAESSQISLTFKHPEGKSFKLIEKKSAWDSATLQRNYVEKTWGTDYSTTHEQGITMYIHDSSAAWVNGGVMYRIDAEKDVLTKKQLRSIITSMQ